jgi:regulator of sigma E protease
MSSIFAFVIVLGVLIFFHELGHFLIARVFGVGVETFSLGFGPRILGKKIGITDYRISAVPLGGFVKMVGEEPDSEVEPYQAGLSFTHKHVFKKILIVAAGPVFNFLLAAVIFFGLFYVYGLMVLKPVVGKVDEKGPAFSAGLRENDQIRSINTIAITSWDDMANLIESSNGNDLDISFLRQEEIKLVTVVPELKITKNLFGEDTRRYMIGIASSGDVFFKKLNTYQAVNESVGQVYKISKLTLISLVKMIQGTISAKDNLGGPIQIAQMAGKFYNEGIANFISFIAFLSITLAVVNFFPIPVLDGGHILFFLVELITGRPVNIKVREMSQRAGVFVLVLLMVFVFYNDIMRLFEH